MSIDKNVGENMRKIRKYRKLTLKQLGGMIGLSEQAIGQYERGEREPSTETLNEIADALGVGIVDILGKNHMLSRMIRSAIYVVGKDNKTEFEKEVEKDAEERLSKALGYNNTKTIEEIMTENEIPNHTLYFKQQLCNYIEFEYGSNFKKMKKSDRLTESELDYLYKKTIEYIELLTEKMKNDKRLAQIDKSVSKKDNNK